MTVCSIAIVAGCKKCPAFSICPLKNILGDNAAQGKEETGKTADSGKSASK